MRTNEESSIRRRPGRPRSQAADAAILAAALDVLIEEGAGQASIERIAQRAGVTRATVYRRFADKTALLVQAIETLHDDHDPSALAWTDVEHMVTEWAGYLSGARQRRMLRRLYGAGDDYPELLAAYRAGQGRGRGQAVLDTLQRAVEAGQLPADCDLAVLAQVLNGAILHHLGSYPDTCVVAEIRAYLAAVLRQLGYRPDPAAAVT